jgi:prolyl 4-hydroxylase
MGKGFGPKENSKLSSNPIEIKQINKSLNSTFRFPESKFPYQNHLPSLNIDYPHLKQIYYDPPIYEIDDFFTPDICLDYIQRAQIDSYQINSQTYTSSPSTKRTSTTWFKKYQDVLELLNNAIKLTNMSIYHFEEPQIVRYELGQQFTWHYDYIPQTYQDSSGNRLATLLVYLNDVKNGGATCFKDLNIQIKPKAGKALLFFPCYKDGKLDDRTLHAGQVAMDTKWIAQM